MEKGGKSRAKNRRDNDLDGDITEAVKELSIKDEQKGNTSKKEKAKKEKLKKPIAAESSDEDEQEEEAEPVGKNKGVTSKFSLLDVESGSDKSSDSEPEINNKTAQKRVKNKNKGQKTEQPTNNADENPKEKANQQPTKSQGKKAKQKADDDFDAILAEFSAPNGASAGEKKDRKKKKGGKKADDDDEEPIVIIPAAEVSEDKGIGNHLMTQEEIAKYMEEMYGPDSDEEKKAKKKAKKLKQKTDKTNEAPAEEADVNEKTMTKIAAKSNKKKGGKEETKDKIQPVPENKVEQPAVQKKEIEPKETAAKMDQSKPDNKASSAEAIKKSEPVLDNVAVEPSEEMTSAPSVSTTDDKATNDAETEEGDSKKDKRKDKRRKKTEKEKKEEEKKEEEKKKPSKLAQKILEQQKFLQQEQERLMREEEERIRKLEEAEKAKEEKERLERERKEREKKKKKEKIERQKAEGRYLTPKQREDRRRAQQMVELMRQQGVDLPPVAEGAAPEADKPRKRVVYEQKKKRKPTTTDRQESDPATVTSSEPMEQEVEEESKESTPDIQAAEEPQLAVAEPEQQEVEDVKDAWDASDEEKEEAESPAVTVDKKETVKEDAEEEGDDGDEDEEGDEPASESEASESESDSEDEDEDERSPLEKAKEAAMKRIQARKEEAESKRTLDILRAPVVCVLGHVDTGKTKILDKLRRTNVQDGEAGGITQQIGATNVPQDTIREQTKMCKEFTKMPLRLPGLLIIDTPGHESFSNLRSRGSSLCDIAILVVDIMHGLEPQTKESIELLKSRKTPFVVALNKIDRLNEWQTNPHTDVATTISKQKASTTLHFNDRVKQVVVEFAELGLNVALFYENKNVREYISMVPTSAHSGDGMGNLIALICELTQTLLAKHLMYSEVLQATVMEVKALPGLGTTIDTILVNGSIREGETIVVAGQEGPIVTQIRALLMPQPLRELRVKSAYEHHKVVRAAQGCKIVAKDLEKALAGLPLFVAHLPDEIIVYKDELSQMLTEVLGSIKVQERGVFVQASTLGSLEALLVFLGTSKIPYAGINIGPVHKRDVKKASIMIEHDPQYAVILAFDVKVEREAQEMAESLGVRIFVADIIYHLFDRFTKYREEWLAQKREEFKHLAVFPCKLRILPSLVFNSRDPIVAGVSVEAGFLKQGTMICVPSKEFLELGRVGSIEINHKPVDKATKGQEVCVKIDPVPGEAPKMFGRHFDHTDILVSKISRESIDTVKNYFREEMSKADWQLVVELKKTFGIL